MKVSDLFEHAEFQNSNDEISIDHLYRVQLSRCHQFCALLDELTRSYPEKMKWFSGNISKMLDVISSWNWQGMSGWALPELCQGDRTGPAIADWSEKERQQYDQKYNRMIKAKQTFQDAGGNYK